jgi:hypothetical protein
VAAGRRDALVLPVVGARQRGPAEDPVILGDQVVDAQVQVRERPEVAEAAVLDALHDALVAVELPDGVEVAAVQDVGVVAPDELLVLLGHGGPPGSRFRPSVRPGARVW